MNEAQQYPQGYQPMPGMQQPQYNVQQGQVGMNQEPLGGYQQPIGGAQNYNPYQQGMMQQPAQQFNPMQGQQPQQHQEKQKSTVVEVIRDNYTTISLFEVSGGYDPAQQYPKALCFVMGVPGVKDASKQSGRTYMQNQKIVMKFSTQEVRSLGQSLINISTFKAASNPFEKHSDPSKNAYTQGNANAQASKKLVAKFDPTKGNIVITMNYGQQNVLVPVPLQDALGLGHSLINIGNFADAKLAEYKISNRIGKEEITGIDYDPAGAEDHFGQGQQAQQPAMMQQQIPQQGGYQAQHMPQQGLGQQPQVQYQQMGMGIPPMGMPGAQ